MRLIAEFYTLLGMRLKKCNSIIWRKSERLVCARFCRMAQKGNRVCEPKIAPMMQIVHELTQLSWVTLTGSSRCTKTPQTQNLWKSSKTCLSLFCFQFQNQSPNFCLCNLFNIMKVLSYSIKSTSAIIFSKKKKRSTSAINSLGSNPHLFANKFFIKK